MLAVGMEGTVLAVGMVWEELCLHWRNCACSRYLRNCACSRYGRGVTQRAAVGIGEEELCL